MLDIHYVRENFDAVRRNLERRKAPEYVDFLRNVLSADESWRKCKAEVDALRARRNRVSEEINAAKKEGKNADGLIKEAKDIPVLVQRKEQEMAELSNLIRSLLMRIPNLLHESVPYGASDADNVEVKKFGRKPKFSFSPLSHVDLLEKFDLADFGRAAKVSGSRWYFLKNELVLLDLALQRYALDFMVQKKFVPVVPPFAVSRKAEESATSLSDFEESIYKVEGDDLYLIPTSEHPLVAQFMDEVFEPGSLPVMQAGISTNFRKETGSHGKDTKGIFRVHQFNKVEQFVVCSPEESWKWHEKLAKNAVEFFGSLGLHGRVVDVCTGDLGIVAAKKYDVEVWFPVQNAYREVASVSNCTSYQAVRGNIRYQDGQERKWVHTLNATCVPTSRAMVAILENFQNKDGSVDIPAVLHKYCGFKTIPKKR